MQSIDTLLISFDIIILVVLKDNKNIKGLIWYADGYHSGTEEDYHAFLQSNENAKLIFTFNEIKPSQLFKLSENLNASNARHLDID